MSYKNNLVEMETNFVYTVDTGRSKASAQHGECAQGAHEAWGTQSMGRATCV